jgi:hypothetical protein
MEIWKSWLEKRGGRTTSAVFVGTLALEDKIFPIYTLDISDRGVRFVIDHELQVGSEFQIVLYLPPEISLSVYCEIICTCRAVRSSINGVTYSIEAEILEYSIRRESEPSDPNFPMRKDAPQESAPSESTFSPAGVDPGRGESTESLEGDFTVSFDSELSPEQVRIGLEALADFFRSCGGVGFRIDWGHQTTAIGEPQDVRG